MTEQERKAEIDRLVSLFNTVDLPAPPFKLSGFMTLHDPALYIATNAERAKLSISNASSECCIQRLQSLEKYMQELQ